eukprot:NODE_1399_length_875_cov_95.655080_g1353_i0.p2 GENE.NODE_1399_length_875_cov_95.655080_g1353_i0~~NODE_1399_length_875_cov_95.655080_g1353_i0.p2  ORF type:complete len:155 (+),score=32.40 NODE_1399_length_875_cov_95.655080_g1353_i0:69-533(+)
MDCVHGVLNKTNQTIVGYMGGHGRNPHYNNYTMYNYTETVRVEYDPTIISYGNLLKAYFKWGNGIYPPHDCAYWPYIWAIGMKQRKIAERALEEYKKEVAPKKVYTTIKDASHWKFWKASPYHQHYFVKQGYTCAKPPPGYGTEEVVGKARCHG